MAGRSITKRETTIGTVILVLLCAIGAGVMVMGRRELPSQYFLASVSNDAQGLTDDQQAGIWAVLPATVADADQRLFRLSQKQYFPAERLWEKIDGQDVKYLSYNVLSLHFAGYVCKAASQQLFLDAYIYDMGQPANALGIYRQTTGEAESPADFGQMGSAAPGSVRFFKDRYYVQVRAEQAGPNSQQLAEQLARHIADKLPGKTVMFWAQKFFPEEDLVADSLSFVKRDAMGLDFMKDVFFASYEGDSGRYRLFLARCDNADQVYRRYRQYLADFGNLLRDQNLDGVEVTISDLFGQLEAVFAYRGYVGGLTDGPSSQGGHIEIVTAALRRLISKIKAGGSD